MPSELFQMSKSVSRNRNPGPDAVLESAVVRMLARRLILAVFALTATLWAAAPQAVPAPAAGSQSAAPAPAANPPIWTAAPQQPQPPPAPEQMPATPPQVSYRNGQLSIVARNSTLRDVLTAVGSATGAHIDMPPGAGNERIFAQVGPGPARDVVASLLADSPMDYIILGSNTAPGGIANITLTASEGGPAQAPPPSSPAQAGQPAQAYQPPEPAEEENAEPDASEPEPAAPPQPEPAAPAQNMPEPGPVVPGTVGQPPDMQPATNPNPQAGTAPTNSNQGTGTPQVKTPEQLLQELQRMQQLQQQQQQQQQQRIPHPPQ